MVEASTGAAEGGGSCQGERGAAGAADQQAVSCQQREGAAAAAAVSGEGEAGGEGRRDRCTEVILLG